MIYSFLNFQCHPDVNSGDKSLHAKFVAINEAYTTLINETTRRDYDVKRGGAFKQMSSQNSYQYYHVHRPYMSKEGMRREYARYVKSNYILSQWISV